MQSGKILKVVSWNKDKELIITDPDESTAKALRRYSVEQGLRDKEIVFSDFPESIKFTRSSLRESISQMSKRGSNLVNLGKLMSVLDAVCFNAIKIDVESYRHVGRKRQNVRQVHHLLSAFHDGENIFPVKITIHEKENQPNQFYMVITVGEIGISHNKKEALTNTGTDHLMMNGSLPDGGASFDVSLSSFVSDFKRDEGIIIKNLPDGLLTEEQRQIKQKVQKSDAEKESLKSQETEHFSKRQLLDNYADPDSRSTIEHSEHIVNKEGGQIQMSEEKKLFEVTYDKNDISHVNIYHAASANEIIDYFARNEADKRLLGVQEHHGTIKPSMPIVELEKGEEKSIVSSPRPITNEAELKNAAPITRRKGR